VKIIKYYKYMLSQKKYHTQSLTEMLQVGVQCLGTSISLEMCKPMCFR